jgi:hypothetical protein
MPPTRTRSLRHPTLLVVLLVACTAACSTPPHEPTADERAALREELRAMRDADQHLERLVQQRDPASKAPGFADRKRTLQDTHAERCRVIFDQHGFPGSDLVGDDGASAFWLLVQHADRHPDLQARVAAAMEQAAFAGHASGEELAYLVDRIASNTGRPQRYGTQTAYDPATGRIRPAPLEAPHDVDARRRAVGLEPLWEYVNRMTELHFRMNEAQLRAHGVDAPPLVPPGFCDW